MSALKSYDGLCGIISQYATSDRQLRCYFEFGHSGPCSYVKQEKVMCIRGCAGITISEIIERAQAGSPAAEAMLQPLINEAVKKVK